MDISHLLYQIRLGDVFTDNIKSRNIIAVNLYTIQGQRTNRVRELFSDTVFLDRRGGNRENKYGLILDLKM